MKHEDIDERLGRLKGATDRVNPRAGFSARVMASIETGNETAAPGSFVLEFRRVRAAIACAALAAVSASMFAFVEHADASAIDEEETLAATLDPEVEW